MKNVEFYNALSASLKNAPVTFYLGSKAFEMYLTVAEKDFVNLDEEGFTVNIGASEFTFYFDNMEISCMEDEYGKSYVLKASEDDRMIFVI